MGRFDALKGNDFTSSTDEQKNNKNNSNRRKNRNKRESEEAKEKAKEKAKEEAKEAKEKAKVKVLVEALAEAEAEAREQAKVLALAQAEAVKEKATREKAKEAAAKAAAKAAAAKAPKEAAAKAPKESEWVKRINIRKAKENSVINLNDPKYWNGPNWTGPMFIRSNKMTKETESYLRNAEKGHASAFIIPYNKPEYSRDDLHWYDSWEETFTSIQLQAMKDFEDENNLNDCFRRMYNLHEQRREESKRHYYETGELDGFAWAEIEAEKYEEYCKNFDEKYGDNDKDNTNVDDLEDDYGDYDE